MNNVDILFRLIDSGKEGKNIGFSTGIPKLDEYTGGIRKGVYTLIFGLSGAGKTALALYCYIYRPLMDNPNADIKLIYYSLEINIKCLVNGLKRETLK